MESMFPDYLFLITMIRGGSTNPSTSRIDVFVRKIIKGCVDYIFAGLFFKPKRERLSKEKWFLFHFRISFHSGENQIVEF